MRVLVTGANGLLGHHVVMELLNTGHDVRIIVRSVPKIGFDLNRVEVVTGSFADRDIIYSAAKDCDGIIHIAAVTDIDLLSYFDYKLINVDATKQIIEAATALSIRKLVFVSTANTIGYGNKKEPADEQNPIEYPFTQSDYAKSKMEAEQLFRSFAKDNHVVIINPTFMIGGYDTKPNSGKLVIMGYKKRFLLLPEGGKNFVYVKDVAVACCNALTMGKSGERYLAAGVNLSFKEYFKIQQKIGAYKQKIIIVPAFILSIIALSGDLLRFFKIKVSFCSRNINQLLIKEYYTNSRTKTDLLLPETPLELAIREALNWFIKAGYIKK
ncbi:MAG: NAD-dependent epimerase/dehydratase family protein [Paludibacter sp.]|nr:NAD-dependent epimerase/dehydratase family protein [Paludibacter sp.]